MKNSLSIMTRKRIHFCRVFYVFLKHFFGGRRGQETFRFISHFVRTNDDLPLIYQNLHTFSQVTHHSQRGFLRNKNLVRLAIVHIKIFIFARESSINHVVKLLRIFPPSWSLLLYKAYVIKWSFG